MLHKIDRIVLEKEHRILIVGVVGNGDIPCDRVLFYDLSKIPSGVPKLENDVIVSADTQDMYNWGMITIDDIRDNIRVERVEAFKALLVYDVAVLNGDEEQSPEQRMIRNNFRKAWLDMPQRLNEDNMFSLKSPIMPDFIAYYKQFK